MEISVADAAARLGITPRRVRDLLRAGELPGHQVAGHWLVDPAGVAVRGQRRPAPGRPLAPWRAWALLGVLEAASGRRSRDDGPLLWPPAASRVGVSQVIRYLRSGELVDAPLGRWQALLSGRSQVHELRGHPAGLRRLLADPRVLPAGGAEAARSGADLVVINQRPGDVYAPADALKALARDLVLQDRRLAPRLVALAQPSEPWADGVVSGHIMARAPQGDPWPGNRLVFPVAGTEGVAVVWASALAADLLDVGEPRSQEAGQRLLCEMAAAAAEQLVGSARGAFSWVVAAAAECG